MDDYESNIRCLNSNECNVQVFSGVVVHIQDWVVISHDKNDNKNIELCIDPITEDVPVPCLFCKKASNK